MSSAVLGRTGSKTLGGRAVTASPAGAACPEGAATALAPDSVAQAATMTNPSRNPRPIDQRTVGAGERCYASWIQDILVRLERA